MLLVTHVINKNSEKYSQSDIDFKKAMLEFERMLEKQNEDFINKYFGSTSKRPIISKSLAMSMKKEAIPSESIISQTSLATKKHGKQQKELKRLYTYLAIIASFMEIKPLQAT
jgi:hypothetical protein